MTKQPKRHARLIVRGIAKRCRKPDLHFIKLGLHDVDTLPEALEPAAREQLSTFKDVTSATLHLEYAEVEDDNIGTSMIIVLHDPRHLVLNLI